jgi:ribosomal protein S18 acetylase RimI-like enzyme
MDEITIGLAGPDRVDDLRELWLELHHHHQKVATLRPLVADDETSWRRRWTTYRAWLSVDEAFLVLATCAGRLVGYALVHLVQGPDDTWDVGDRFGDVYSLSVASDMRGQGVGGRLLDGVDAELNRQGIHGVMVSVMVGNADAQRFYERRGLQPGEINLFRYSPPGNP